LTTEKRRQAAALQVSAPAAVGGADYRKNCELELAMREIKKAAEKLPQSEKIRTLT
jgi:hypothetical protein